MRRPSTADVRRAVLLGLGWVLVFVGSLVLSYRNDHAHDGPLTVGWPFTFMLRGTAFTPTPFWFSRSLAAADALVCALLTWALWRLAPRLAAALRFASSVAWRAVRRAAAVPSVRVAGVTILGVAGSGLVLASVARLPAVKEWRAERAREAEEAFENPAPDAPIAERLAPARITPAIVAVPDGAPPDPHATIVTIGEWVRIDGRQSQSFFCGDGWTDDHLSEGLAETRRAAVERHGPVWSVLIVPDANARWRDVETVWWGLIQAAAPFPATTRVAFGVATPSADGTTLAATAPTVPDYPGDDGEEHAGVNHLPGLPWLEVVLIAAPREARWSEVAPAVIASLHPAPARVLLRPATE